jgi:hypothetical protein
MASEAWVPGGYILKDAGQELHLIVADLEVF